MFYVISQLREGGILFLVLSRVWKLREAQCWAQGHGAGMEARSPDDLSLPTRYHHDPQTTASCPNPALPLGRATTPLSSTPSVSSLGSFVSLPPPPQCTFRSQLLAYSRSLPPLLPVTSPLRSFNHQPQRMTLKSASHPKRVPKPKKPTLADSALQKPSNWPLAEAFTTSTCISMVL